MPILINTDALIVVHRHSNRATLSFLAHIELSHNSCVIINERGSFEHFSLEKLYILYKNTTGEWKYGTHAVVAAALSDICETMPLSNVLPFEVMSQAMSVPMTDKGYYRYRKWHSTPLACTELPVLQALRGNATAQVSPTPTAPVPVAPAPVKAPPAVQPGAAPKYAPPWA